MGFIEESSKTNPSEDKATDDSKVSTITPFYSNSRQTGRSGCDGGSDSKLTGNSNLDGAGLFVGNRLSDCLVSR
jgi:hypothetical protein